ncbi:NEAT domain-containing protein [Hathewaya limosa]|uniref:Heme-binding NEAT domain protein n=1 Tax=Hathewaya limosa TaxID=1536 RepID=A0ABU0JNX3_HATLI|nr:NEAT domain-containing protein [Hathewaya limosa]MDQ0478788.1 heme-binding NEAT domain protein [Hathewaya limosa]
MSKMNNKKKSVGIALTGFLVLGGISQSHVYAFENKNDSSIELHKQSYLSPDYLKKQLNNCSASLNIENDLNKNKYISVDNYSRKILTANSRNSLNKDNTSSEKLTTIKLEKNIDQTNIKTKKNQKHNTGDIEKESVKSSTTEPEEKPSKPVQKEVSTDKDGIYEAEIKTLKEKSDEISMSGTYFEKKAKYTKQNGKVYCEINVLAIDWMKNIKVFLNSKEVNPTITKTGKTKVMGMDHEGATLKFEVDKVNPELTFKMYVEPMSSNVTFRVVGEKLKFEALKDTKPANKEDKEKDKTKPSTTKPEEKPAKPVQKEVSTDKDGIYEAEIKTLKEKSDETSMSGTYFEKKAKYTKQNGKVYCEINVLAIDWMKNIKVFLNSKEVNPTITKTGKTKVMGMDHEGATLKFEVDKVNPELTFKMYVEPMSSNVTFRVVGEKLKFEALKDTKPANKEDKEKDKTKPSTTKPEEKPDVKQDKDKQKDNQNKPKESENKPSEKPIEKPVQKSEVTKSINIVALKENSNEQSMAGDYLNGTVQYTEKDGKKFFTLTVTRIDWMKNIDVSVDGAKVPYDKKELGQIAELTFEVNSENSEVTMHMNVVPMGNSRVAFRVLNENNVSVEKPDVKPTEPKNNENKDNQDKPKESQKEDKQKEQPQTKINKEILKIVKFKNLKKGSYNNVKTLVSCDNKKHEKLLKENLDIKTDIKITEEKDVMVTILLKGKYANVTNILVDGKSVISSEVSKNRKGLLAPEGIVINKIVEEKLNESKVVQFKLPNINSKIELVTEDSKIPNEQIKANIDIKNDLVSKSLDKTTLPKEIVNKDLDNQSSSQSSKQIKDGMYNVSIKTLKESSDEPSMAGGYIEKVNYEVKDGKQFILLKLNRLDWMTNITATVDGKTITPTIIERTKNDKGEEKGIVKFEVSSPESKIKLTMNVEPMGNARVSFRVIPEVNSLKLIDQNDAKDQEQKSNEKPLDQNQQVKSDNKDKEKPKEDNTKNKDEQKDDKEKPKESEKKPSGRQDNKEKHSFYEIKVDTLKEKDNSPSMAGEYIKASNYEIKGDKKYLILTLNRTDWMTNIKAIVDGKEITPTIVESFKNSKGEETSRIKFEIPSLESPIKLSMNVEPMGNSRVTFRVVPNKNSLKPINNLNSITNAPAKKTNLDPNSKKKELEPIEETIINSGKEESNNKKNSLPKTGLPINTGILATLGTILSGLGISLKKFKK